MKGHYTEEEKKEEDDVGSNNDCMVDVETQTNFRMDLMEDKKEDKPEELYTWNLTNLHVAHSLDCTN
eukprot:5846993-Ditylum_brightwellii.AAC.2